MLQILLYSCIRLEYLCAQLFQHYSRRIPARQPLNWPPILVSHHKKEMGLNGISGSGRISGIRETNYESVITGKNALESAFV